MNPPLQHVFQQGPVLLSMGRTLLTALARLVPGSRPVAPLPSAWIQCVVPPRPMGLITDFIRHVGGDPWAYRGRVPPMLWSQWGYPVVQRTLADLPYPLLRVLNGGCRIENRAPLPAGQPLHVRARLVDVDDNGTRAVLHQEVVTGTAEVSEAVVAHLYAIIPLKHSTPREGPASKEVVRVPHEATEITRWELDGDAGLRFALLTGDFNPIHWLAPYARLSGFDNRILHGFSTMARSMEALLRWFPGGDPDRVHALDVRFVRPLVLPNRVGLYVAGNRITVGQAPGEPVYMHGTVEFRAGGWA